MLTVCPKCTLTLAVTASDLRLGQGYVRCGRCAAVFNALLSLSDDTPELSFDEPPTSSVPEAPPEPWPETPPATAPSSPVIHRDDELVESQGNETLETIILEGDGAMHTEEFVDIATINREIAEATLPRISDDEHPSMVGREIPEHWLEEPEASAEDNDVAASPIADQAMTVEEAPAEEPPSRRPALAWAAAAALLALILGLQLIHYWRNELALSPTWYALLQRPYQLLGTPLYPDRDLNSYALLQLGGGADATGNIFHVQLRLANRAEFSQPFPVVRLRLYNRFGKLVSARDLQPRDYLPAAVNNGNLMTRAQNYDSDVGIGDSKQEFASFELDVCTPAPGGLRCANDQTTTAKSPT